jgi:hypothetical protein
MLQAMAAAEVIRKSEARYTALCTDNDRAHEIAVLVAEDATWPVRRQAGSRIGKPSDVSSRPRRTFCRLAMRYSVNGESRVHGDTALADLSEPAGIPGGERHSCLCQPAALRDTIDVYQQSLVRSGTSAGRCSQPAWLDGRQHQRRRYLQSIQPVSNRDAAWGGER